MKISVLPVFVTIAVAVLMLQCSDSKTTAAGNPHNQSLRALLQQIDSLNKIGQYRSAQPLAEDLLDRSIAQSEPAYAVRAMRYKLQFNNHLSDSSDQQLWPTLIENIERSRFPVKNVLQAFAANTLWQHYQHNSWRINSRKTEVETTDIRMWSRNQFVSQTAALYQRATAEEKLLNSVDWPVVQPVLLSDTAYCAPGTTLYDLLAREASSFYLQNEVNLSMPGSALTNPLLLLGDNQEFVNIKLPTDEDSYWTRAIQLYQRRTAFHSSGENQEALARLTLERLGAFKKLQNEAQEEQNNRYLNTLKTTRGQLSSAEARGYIMLAEAVFYEQNSTPSGLNPSGVRSDYLTKALNLCNEVLVIENCPDDLSGPCEAMASRILRKGLNVAAEKVIAPAEHWRSLLRYRNIDKAYYSIVPFDYQDYLTIMENRDREEQMMKIYATAMLRQLDERVVFDRQNKHEQRSYEVVHPPLPSGFYVMITAPEANPTLDTTQTTVTPFWVSNISWMQRKNETNQNEFRLVHRKTGLPLIEAEVQVYDQVFNRYSRVMENNLAETLTSDKNGLITVPPRPKDRRFALKVSHRGETTWIDQSFYQGTPPRSRPPHTRTHFFTDRQVYRPGQTVHFKGVAIEYSQGDRKVRPNLKESVALYDVNSQVVAKTTHTTNEYGTFNGSFELPESGLTGTFRLETGHGSHYFSVEEYKRPTFQVEMLPVDSAYSLESVISARGKATSLAGFPLAQVTVNYRVIRYLEYPYWGWFAPAYSEQQLISSGVVRTDDNGEFTIAYEARGSGNLLNYQHYRFQVEVDVVDISGESQSATQALRIGKRSLILGANVADVVLGKELNSIAITASNLNGDPVSAQGELEILALETPLQPLRKRLWPTPDQIEIDSTRFASLFPDDEYLQSVSINNALVGDRILSTSFNTSETSQIEVVNKKGWKPGWYLLRLTSTDQQGKAVDFERRFKVLSATNEHPPLPELLFSKLSANQAEAGETIKLWVSSAVDATVWVETELNGKTVNRKRLNLKSEIDQISIPVAEDYRGGFGIHLSMVHGNRMYTKTHRIEVPYSNKKLSVSLETLRDKLLPGSKEQWTVRVLGPDSTPINAEILAGMYDASLDALGFQNNWSLNPWSNNRLSRGWQNQNAFVATEGWQYQKNWNNLVSYYAQNQCVLKLIGDWPYRYYNRYDNMAGIKGGVPEMAMVDEDASLGQDIQLDEVELEQMEIEPGKEAKESESIIPLRANFEETAFFIPDLQTDQSGRASFTFTLPESLTTWKWMFLAQGKNLETGAKSGAVVASKPVMVIPNSPRYLRQGDEFRWSAQVRNNTDQDQQLVANLSFVDAETDKPLSGQFIPGDSQQQITVKAGSSKAVFWSVTVPDYLGLVNARTTVKADGFTDGEQRPLPVLTNRMLVTETLPISLFGQEKKTFELDHLVNSAEAKGNLKHHRLTLEFSANPVWYAVQALPYLMEYPHECSEQIFSRFYANALAGHIVQQKPVIAETFRKYAESSPDALLSNLEKNQELKQLLIEETPWLLNAKNESASKQRIALLFELSRMEKEQEKALRKLAEIQLFDGSWPWFKGMKADRYITQYIVAGIAKLKRLGVEAASQPAANQLVQKALVFLDKAVVKDHQDRIERGNQTLSALDVHYLYLRGMFPGRHQSKALRNTISQIWELADEQWTHFDLRSQAMLAFSATNSDKAVLGDLIVRSLDERSILHPDQGRYWKAGAGQYWYSQPIETQSMLIDLYSVRKKDRKWINEMRHWLLSQKRTQHWQTTVATADACYALLLGGDDWLELKKWPEIQVGSAEIVFEEGPVGDHSKVVHPEPGTGQFKAVWNGNEITPSMGKVTVTNHHDAPAWGGVYWQFFQDRDQVSAHDGGLKITREYFVLRHETNSTKMVPIGQHTPRPGDRVVVRIELEADRNFNYVHLSDQRAAGLEPVDVRSGYQFNAGLGFYRSVKDAANNFFFSHLPKGRHVFEYELRANLKGDFSNGPSTVQCMYAPEFGAHSAGERISVE